MFLSLVKLIIVYVLLGADVLAGFAFGPDLLGLGHLNVQVACFT